MGRRRSSTAFRNGVAVWVYDSDSDTETVRGRSSKPTPVIYADSVAPRKRSGTVLRDGIPLLLCTDDRNQEQALYREIGLRTAVVNAPPSNSVEFVWDDHQDTDSSDDDYSPSRSARRISELSLRRGGLHCSLLDNVGPDICRRHEAEARPGVREARRMSEYSTYGYSLAAEARRVGYRPNRSHSPSPEGCGDV